MPTTTAEQEILHQALQLPGTWGEPRHAHRKSRCGAPYELQASKGVTGKAPFHSSTARTFPVRWDMFSEAELCHKPCIYFRLPDEADEVLRGSVTSSPCEQRPSCPKKHPTSAYVGPAKTGTVTPTCSFLRIRPLKWGHLQDKLPFAGMNDQYEFVGKIPRTAQPPPLTANGRAFQLSLISITFAANTVSLSDHGSLPRNKVPAGAYSLPHDLTSHPFPIPTYTYRYHFSRIQRLF